MRTARTADAARRAAAAATVLVAAACGRPHGCAVEVVSPDPAARVRIELRSSGAAAASVLDVGTDGTRIDVAPGAPVRAHASAADAVVWPRSQPLRDGGVATFHVEPLRSVTLRSETRRAPGGAARRAPLRLRFVPDRDVVPTGPPERIDALQAWIDTETPAVVAARACDDTSIVAVARLPATAWWVLGEASGKPVAEHVGADETTLTVGAAPPRTLAREPTVGGRVLPEHTLIAPGRLDVVAAAAVRVIADIGDFRGAHVRGPGPWTPVTLADTPWVTLAHPSFGVAHARWEGDVLGDASPRPGTITFVRRGGGCFWGHAAAWPAWPGTGDVFSRPSDRCLRVGVVAAERLVLRGLSAGEVRYDWSAAPDAGGPGAALRRGRVRVDPSRPETVVELDMGP